MESDSDVLPAALPVLFPVTHPVKLPSLHPVAILILLPVALPVLLPAALPVLLLVALSVMIFNFNILKVDELIEFLFYVLLPFVTLAFVKLVVWKTVHSLEIPGICLLLKLYLLLLVQGNVELFKVVYSCTSQFLI